MKAKVLYDKNTGEYFNVTVAGDKEENTLVASVTPQLFELESSLEDVVKFYSLEVADSIRLVEVEIHKVHAITE